MIIQAFPVWQTVGRSKRALGCILEVFVLLPCFILASSQNYNANFALPTINASTIHCTGNSSLALLGRDGNGAISLSPPHQYSTIDPGFCIYKNPLYSSDHAFSFDTMFSFNATELHETQTLTFFLADSCGSEASAAGLWCPGLSRSLNSNLSVHFTISPDGSIYADHSIYQDGAASRSSTYLQEILLAPAQPFPKMTCVCVSGSSHLLYIGNWCVSDCPTDLPYSTPSRNQLITYSLPMNLNEVFNSSVIMGFSTGVNYYSPVEVDNRQPIDVWSWSAAVGTDPPNMFYDSEEVRNGEESRSIFSNIIVPAVMTATFVPFGLLVAISYLLELYWRRTAVSEKDVLIQANKDLEEERANLLSKLKLLDFGAREFTHKELHEATKGFSNEIGRGGFGLVFKGKLPGFGAVAVKSIRRTEGNADDAKQLVAEVQVIGRVRHVNIVPLYGWCYENDVMLLVYKFINNGDLDSHLFPKIKSDAIPLAWTKRMKSLRGIAAALVFLHEEFESEERVIHRDIKPTNVMLDSDFNARLGDFGLARLSKRSNDSYQTQSLGAGTWGYIAPEYDLGPSTETDVYAFGVMILVVATGRKALDKTLPGSEGLVKWVRSLYDEGRLLEAGDINLQNARNWSAQLSEEMEKVLNVGLYCCLYEASQRPSMREVLTTLQESSTMLQAQMPPHFPSQVPYESKVENVESNTSAYSSLEDHHAVTCNESCNISRDASMMDKQLWQGHKLHQIEYVVSVSY